MFEYFYHATTRKVAAAFGTLFNSIQIARYDGDGNEVKRIKVPLFYGHPQKFIRRYLSTGPSFDWDEAKVETYLPRLAFTVGNPSYDSMRKLNPIDLTVRAFDGTTMSRRYGRVPYTMDFNLWAMTKNMEDALQIYEQIIPYFTPDYTVTINMNPIDDKVDVPFVLKSVAFDGDDTSQGDYETRKVAYINFSFTAKVAYCGPIHQQGVIEDSIVNVFDWNDGLTGMTAATVEAYPATGVTAGSFYPESPTAQSEIREY